LGTMPSEISGGEPGNQGNQGESSLPAMADR
jgi:hypothetical protein